MKIIQTATMENHNWSQAEFDDYSDMVYSRNIKNLIDNFIF